MTVPSTERRVEIRRRLAMAKIAASNAPDTFWHTFVEDTEYLMGQVEELEGHLSVRPVIEQTIGELTDERDALQGQLDEQRWYGEQMQASLDSCSGNHLPIEDYDERALGLGEGDGNA